MDTPVLAAFRALWGCGWCTIPPGTKVEEEKKVITMGVEHSPKGTGTFRLPEGFFAIGPALEPEKIRPPNARGHV